MDWWKEGWLLSRSAPNTNQNNQEEALILTATHNSFWLTSHHFHASLVICQLKYYVYRSDIDRILLAPLFILWVLAEVARLYSGFTGNLREMVPQVSQAAHSN
jgi:hypothetical protein